MLAILDVLAILEMLATLEMLAILDVLDFLLRGDEKSHGRPRMGSHGWD